MSRLVPGCLVAAIALVATIGGEIHRFSVPDPGTLPIRSPASGGALAAPAPDPSAVAQAWVDAALERPLFRENRRPEPASARMAAKEGALTRLAGVLTGSFGNRAIFVMADTPKPVLVQQGARIGGFVVRSIEPGRVVVDVDGTSRMLMPSFAETGSSSQSSAGRAASRIEAR